MKEKTRTENIIWDNEKNNVRKWELIGRKSENFQISKHVEESLKNIREEVNIWARHISTVESTENRDEECTYVLIVPIQWTVEPSEKQRLYWDQNLMYT